MILHNRVILAMKITYTVTQLTESGICPESPKKTAPLGEVLFHEMQCFFGVLPPLDVLNDTLRQGQIVNVKNQLFQWSQFELSEVDYEELKGEVLAHPDWETDVDETFSGPISDWSHWALVRAISK